MPREQEKICFVISPIGEDESPERLRANQVLEHIIKPAVEEYGYDVIRADHISRPGMITIDIITLLKDAPIVIADLTDHNPNVFYELAVRHALNKPVISLIAKGQSLPFDVAQSRTIHFNHQDLDSAANCKEQIKKQLQAIEKDQDQVDNPITTAIDIQALVQSDNIIEKNIAKSITLLEELRSIVLDQVTDTNATHQTPGSVIPSIYHLPYSDDERSRFLEIGRNHVKLEIIIWNLSESTLGQQAEVDSWITELKSRITDALPLVTIHTIQSEHTQVSAFLRVFRSADIILVFHFGDAKNWYLRRLIDFEYLGRKIFVFYTNADGFSPPIISKLPTQNLFMFRGDKSETLRQALMIVETAVIEEALKG